MVQNVIAATPANEAKQNWQRLKNLNFCLHFHRKMQSGTRCAASYNESGSGYKLFLINIKDKEKWLPNDIVIMILTSSLL